MYRILKATKDTYVTNRIINNKFRATDANVGQAGTLDLFKLYDESTLTGTSTPIELSRLLIKFNFNPLKELTASLLDISHSSFKATLKLYDVYGGQPTPSNFNIILHPLSQSFDEGIGRDVFNFADVDSCNYITASVSNSTATTWFVSGAEKQGLLGSEQIDIISSGNLLDGSGVVDLWKTQLFAKGDEDLSIDITNIVSATLKNIIPNHGFRLAFSGTNETDNKSRFVKRFATRHSTNTRITPRIIIQYNDSLHDNSENFVFDVSGSLFLNNFHRGQPANILTGSKAIGLSGSSCLKVRLKSGSFSQTFTGSQHQIGNNFITGVYSASFAISSYNSILMPEIINSSSVKFDVFWGDNDSNTIVNSSSYGYHTSSITINSAQRTSFGNAARVINLFITNLQSAYASNQVIRLQAFARDVNKTVKFSKLPRESRSVIFDKIHYRVLDAYSGDIIIPFDTDKNSTLLSTNTDRMYFDLYMTDFDIGKVYQIDFKVIDYDTTQIFEDVGRFRVDA